MPITVTRARIKEKCGIADSTHDSAIDNLIAELSPAIEFNIRDTHLADSGNVNLQATLNLGATEIVAAEFLDQLARAPGASESLSVGSLTITPNDGPARLLKSSGWRRLRPFLKADPSAQQSSGIKSAGGKLPTQGNES